MSKLGDALAQLAKDEGPATATETAERWRDSLEDMLEVDSENLGLLQAQREITVYLQQLFRVEDFAR